MGHKQKKCWNFSVHSSEAVLLVQLCGPTNFINQMCFWFHSGGRNRRVPPTCQEPMQPKCDCVCEHNEAERRVMLLLFTSGSLCRQRGDGEPNTLTCGLSSPPHLSILSSFSRHFLSSSLTPPSRHSLTTHPSAVSPRHIFHSFSSFPPPFRGQIFVFLRLTSPHRHHGPTH